MTADTSEDSRQLQQLVEIWHEAAQDVIRLLRDLDDGDWDRPTDLPGWDVRAVAAHLAHLESELAGNPQEQVEVPDAPHIKGLMGQFTEAGPIARASWPIERVVDELETSVETRYAGLLADPPSDPQEPGPGFAGLIGWTWETLLNNRPLDIWMHEQDIRRATDRPGGLDSPAATHAASVFARALPFVLGKKVGAASGTTVVLEVTGEHPQTYAAQVGDNGRGALLEPAPDEPTTRITLDFETWMVLAGGRRANGGAEIGFTGDRALGDAVIANLAVTP